MYIHETSAKKSQSDKSPPCIRKGLNKDNADLKADYNDRDQSMFPVDGVFVYIPSKLPNILTQNSPKPIKEVTVVNSLAKR